MMTRRYRLALTASVALATLSLATAPALTQEVAPAPLATPDVQPDPDVAPEPTLPVEVAPDASPDPEVVPEPDAEPEIVAIPEIWSPVPRNDQGRSAYGLYLAGRNAITQGQGEVGAALLGEAQSLTPEQPAVSQQAFASALLTGDLDEAGQISLVGDDVSPTLSGAGRLVSAVQTYVNGDARSAYLQLTEIPIPVPHGLAAQLILPWIEGAAGVRTPATVPDAGGRLNDLQGLTLFQRAQVLEAGRRYDDADALYRFAASNPAGQTAFTLGYGRFLERRGRRPEAVALYDAAIAAKPNERELVVSRDRALARRRPPPVLDLKQGAADALVLAAGLASRSGANEFAAVYLRLSLNLAPSDEARLELGSTLARAGLGSAARAAFRSVPANDSIYYIAARANLAGSLAEDGEDEAALAAIEDAARINPEDPRIARLLAGQFLQLERYDEALALLDGPLLNRVDQPGEYHFLRGAAYESTGRIEEAEAELWAALQAEPDNANYLNYLGYLWVDSGRRVAQGTAMIQRAHASEPNNGNIQDSLGWSQYRQRQYDTAVLTLEQAVAKEPANAEINDHLGDAYWQVGRRREAGFQWERVLTLEPDAERKTEIERKLEQGLGEVETVAMIDPVQSGATAIANP